MKGDRQRFEREASVAAWFTQWLELAMTAAVADGIGLAMGRKASARAQIGMAVKELYDARPGRPRKKG